MYYTSFKFENIYFGKSIIVAAAASASFLRKLTWPFGSFTS
jgi:hypothetical protein